MIEIENLPLNRCCRQACHGLFVEHCQVVVLAAEVHGSDANVLKQCRDEDVVTLESYRGRKQLAGNRSRNGSSPEPGNIEALALLSLERLGDDEGEGDVLE